MDPKASRGCGRNPRRDKADRGCARGSLAASSFVGRSAELAALADLTAQERLVTPARADGCGKTRLTMEFARSVPPHGFVEPGVIGPRSDLAGAAGVLLDVLTPRRVRLS